MSRIMSLKNICNSIVVDKTTTTKNTDKSSVNTQSMKYSRYVNANSRNYNKITETEIISINVILLTAMSATITYTYYSKPAYVSIIVTNIQNKLDTHSFIIYNIPFTITDLSQNSYYTIYTKTVFASGNVYTKTFENVILTLLEGYPLEPITITNSIYSSAVLTFGLPVGNVTSVDLTVLDASRIFFYPNITSPFLITGLDPDITYDISLSSFYNSSHNSFLVYKPAFFKTFYENYPVFIGATNIGNNRVTITYSFTTTPDNNTSSLTNTLLLTNTNNKYDTSFNIITDNSMVIFTGLHIDTSYNLEITSAYKSTGHTYLTLVPNTFHTLREGPVYDINILELLYNIIIINFKPAPGNVSEYIVTLADINNYTIIYNYTTYPSSVSFYELIQSMNYTLTIKSNYIDNSYTYTYPNYIQTPSII